MTPLPHSESLLQKEAKMMKLEKLIAVRETISTKEFPIPVKEMLARYEQLYTGAISDVLREHALLDQGIGQVISPVIFTLGALFTVKAMPATLRSGRSGMSWPMPSR